MRNWTSVPNSECLNLSLFAVYSFQLLQAFRYHFFPAISKSPCASVFLAAGFINNSWHKSGANNSFIRTAACHTTAAVLPCNFLLLVQSPFIPRLLSVERNALKMSSEDCESMIPWAPQFWGLVMNFSFFEFHWISSNYWEWSASVCHVTWNYSLIV